MKVWSWRHAVQEAAISSVAKRVLLNFSIHMNERGENCFPGIPAQAECTGLSERSVYRGLKEAVEAGLLDWEKIKVKEKKTGSYKIQNLYVPKYPDHAGFNKGKNIGEATPDCESEAPLTDSQNPPHPPSAGCALIPL